MPKVYFTDRGIVSVLTGTTAVHELPYYQRIISGLTPPAAAPGTKQLAGKARCKIEIAALCGLNLTLTGTLASKVTATCTVRTNRVELSGTATCLIRTPRCVVSTGGTTVTRVGAGTGAAANNASVSPTPPTRQVGDFLIAIGYNRDSASPAFISTATGGWTQVGGFPAHMRAWWRIATNDANDNITIDTSSGANDTMLGQIYAYRGVDPNEFFCDRFVYNGSPDQDWYTMYQSADTTSLEAFGYPNSSDTANYEYTNAIVNSYGVVFVGLDDDNTMTTTSLSSRSGPTPANTSDEATFIAMNEQSSLESQLGADASLLEFGKGVTTAMNPCAIWATVNYTAPNVSTVSALSAVLKPVTDDPKVYLDALATSKVTTTCELYSTSGIRYLDGTLTARQTATLSLQVLEGKKLDGLLPCSVSTQFTLTVPHIFDTPMRMRMTAIAVLNTGDWHNPAALLQNRISASAILTLNYIEVVARVPIYASCVLHVEHKVAGTALVHQTATADLQDLRAFAASISLSMTATARLTMPLSGFAALRVTALAVPDVQRYFVGSALEHFSASAVLRTERTFAGLAVLHQTATMVVEAPRLFAGKLYLKTTASASLDVARQLGSLMLCHWTATMNFQPLRPVLAPVFAEVFVNPEMEPDATTLGIAVIEETADSAYVEEDE